MDVLSTKLAEQTRNPPPGQRSVSDTPSSERKSVEEFSSLDTLQQVVTSTPTNALSPNNLRPTNPTPAHATGNGTPTPLRPNNPTPAHASSKPVNVRPSNPTPKHATDQQERLNESPNYDATQWRSNLESVQEVTHNLENYGTQQGNDTLNNGDLMVDTRK